MGPNGSSCKQYVRPLIGFDREIDCYKNRQRGRKTSYNNGVIEAAS
jgi:hypothetical protein